MKWFRWYNETTRDPKFKAIARKAKAPFPVVLATWAVILEECSDEAGTEWGTYNIEAEDIAALLDVDEDMIDAVLACMKERGLLAGDGTVTSWDKRQYRDNSTKRTQAYRERRANGAGTACDASQNAQESESESESIPVGTGEPVLARLSVENYEAVLFRDCHEWLCGIMKAPPSKNYRSLIGKWRKEVPDARLFQYFMEAERVRPANAVEFISGCVRDNRNTVDPTKIDFSKFMEDGDAA